MKNNLIKKEDKKEEKNIKSTLFQIEENKELINSLHLTQFKFDFIDNKISNENEENNKKEDNNTKINNENENNKKDKIQDNKNEPLENGNKEDNENNKNINNNKNNEIDNDNDNDNDDDNDIILNLNINQIKNGKEKSENDNKNENNVRIKIENNDINDIIDKNNISKIIDDLSFNDDTLLINPLTINQNDTIYHKKIKNDYPLDLKNPKRRENRENSIIDKNNQNIIEHQNQKILNQNILIQNNPNQNALNQNNLSQNALSQNNPNPNQIQIKTQEIPKIIQTKKIDISEINKSIKLVEQKIEIISNSSKNKIAKNSFSISNDTRSIGNDNNNIHNKNEVIINFSKRLSGSKKNQPICANYTQSEKKNVFIKQGDGAPILMSRSPGRMTCKSKLAGFYSFVPLDKNKNKIEVNQHKNNDKTIISNQEKNVVFSDKYQNKNNNKNAEDENDVKTEYSSNTNIRRTSFCINKNIKKMKTLSKDVFSNNKIIKKINSAKVVANNDEQNSTNNEEDKYNLTCYNSNSNNNNNAIKLPNNNNLLNSTTNMLINNSSNSYENKSKKELQEFITNQLKNNKPNFSRINMNGYGTQYLCSYLHKNPNKDFKELKLLGCNLNDDDLFILTRTLLDHDIGLLVLNLSSNKITDDSASNILDILKDCKSLKGLSLYNNMISDLLKEKLKEYAKLGRKNFEMVQLYI